MPSQETGSGCDLGCGGLDAISSHELVEAITDAEVSFAIANGPPLGWYDNTNNAGEIADICARTVPGSVTGGDGRRYVVQQEWSNRARGCVLG